MQSESDGPVKGRLGVLLMNMGGPGSLDEVRPYLSRLFSDPHMIDLPLGRLYQDIFAWILARARAKTSVERYRLIGGGSPLGEITRRQAAALEARLAEVGTEARVYVAMRYTAPSAAEALGRMKEDGVEQVLALPLYPQFSRTTTGSSFQELDRIMGRMRPDFTVGRVESWHDAPAFLAALAGRIREGIEGLPADRRDGARLLFCAHALPRAYVDRGDPYVDQVRATVAGVMERIGTLPWRLAFQSRLGPVEWVGPSVEEVIDALAREGTCAVLAVPVSFVSENLETLYDLDIALRDRARDLGIEHFMRVAALNDDPAFIEALCEIVKEHFDEPNIGG